MPPASRCCRADDLYARLELPIDASPEAIEIAWRALLKRHHPDVAGAHADDVAKRINVAHDWLSDPGLRERYDRERHPGHRRSRRQPDVGRRRGRVVRHAPPPPTRPASPEEALARHLAEDRPADAGRARSADPRRVAADRVRRDDRPVPFARSARRRRGCRATGAPGAASTIALGRTDARRDRRVRPRDRPRAVPRRAPLGAVPGARP